MGRGLIGAVVFALMCAGCAEKFNVSDELITGSLRDPGTAVAILTVSSDDDPCSVATLQLARKTAIGFEPTTSVEIDSQPASSNAVLALPVGEHHIVSYRCSHSQTTTTVGQKKGTFLGFGGSYPKSLASFTLAAGEIVNIGHLRILPVGLANIVTFTVQDQPEAVVEKLKTSKPKLFANMQTRLMTIMPPQVTEEQRQAYCRMITRIAATQEDKLPLPSVCLGWSPA